MPTKTLTTKPSRRRTSSRNSTDQFKKQFKGMDIMAEVVAFTSKSDDNRTHTQRDVIAALTKVGLNAKLCPDLLPKAAFARAAKEMEDNRVIKIISRDGSEMRIQFTGETLDRNSEEWQYHKEGIIVLNEVTGKLSLHRGKQSLVDMAQKLLDEHTVRRTTADITRIVQRFFEGQADLIPFREQGGTYIVLTEHVTLVNQIEGFLLSLGGKMPRLPIPRGTESGDKTVQECIGDFAKNLIKEHKLAVNDFSINTRKDTIEREVERIKKTRERIKGYAILMEVQKEELLKVVDEADSALVRKINGFDEERKTNPEAPGGESGKRPKIFGHGLCAVVRWCRGQDWTKKEVNLFLGHFKMTASKNMMAAQYWRYEHWKDSNDPTERRQGEPANFTKKQEEELHKIYKRVCLKEE